MIPVRRHFRSEILKYVWYFIRLFVPLHPLWYSNLKVNGEAKTSDESITLTFDVKNTGNPVKKPLREFYFSETIL